MGQFSWSHDQKIYLHALAEIEGHVLQWSNEHKCSEKFRSTPPKSEIRIRFHAGCIPIENNVIRWHRLIIHQ